METTVERVPAAAMPVHVHLLVESGIHIIEALNLEELAASRPETLEWIQAQGFQYDKLDRVTIMRTLAELADISPEEERFTGILEVQDCVGDDGPVVQRAFAMQLGLRGEEVVLAVAQEGLSAA